MVSLVDLVRWCCSRIRFNGLTYRFNSMVSLTDSA